MMERLARGAMKGPRRLSVWVVVFLAGCEGGDTLDPRAEPPSSPAAPDPPPAAASLVIEVPKVLEDRLTHALVDLNEWVSADTTFIDYSVIRVTARDQAGRLVTGAEPVVRFASGGDIVTYRPLHGDRLQEVRLQRASGRGVWSILTRETPAETQFLTITARLGNAADTMVVILPTTLDTVTAPRTLPYGINLDNVGERVSTPLNWFSSRAGAADIRYEFLVEDDPSHRRPILEVAQNGSGELEITAVGQGRGALRYRARSSAFEQSTGWFLAAVDHCYTPERRTYERASTGFRVNLVFEEPDHWSTCAKALLDHAVGFYEAALKANTDPLVFPIWVYDGDERCPGRACGGPRGPRVEREEGDGFYFARGGIYWREDGVYATPFGHVPIQVTYETMLHELGHAFGIGTYWHYGDVQLVNASRNPGRMADTHFPGPNAVAAFDEAGGGGYGGGKVPVMNNPSRPGADQHWRSMLCGEIMSYSRCGERRVVSAITLGALADFGWIVDMSVAEEYTLPSADMAASILADSIVGHDDVLMLVEPPDGR